jgi:hypothetical protein
MAFDINAFTAEMHSVGFARPSDFEVEIGGDILSKVGSSSFGLSSSLSVSYQQCNITRKKRRICRI